MHDFKNDDKFETKAIDTFLALNLDKQSNDDDLNQYGKHPEFILNKLNSTKDSDIASGYQILSELSKHDICFDFFELIPEHTESENPLISECSQSFLIQLFSNHPFKVQVYYNFITNEETNFQYFYHFLELPFVSTTSKFLTYLFKSSQFLRSSEFTTEFFQAFFDSLNSADPIQLYLRLKFLRSYLKFDDAIEAVYEMTGIFIIESFQSFTEDQKDRDDLNLYLEIVYRCANHQDEKWMNEFIVRNYIEILFNLYSIGDDEINSKIVATIIGFISAQSQIASQLIPHNLLAFFNANFQSINDERLQRLFILAIYNIFCYEEIFKFKKEEFVDPFLESQFFHDILQILPESSLQVKAEILRLIAKLTEKVRHEFIHFLTEYEVIPVFVDVLKSLDSMDDMKDPIFRFFEKITGMYSQTHDSDIEMLLINDDLVEFFENYISESEQDDSLLGTALMIKEVLYKVNDCAD